jgi:hypothetical protein
MRHFKEKTLEFILKKSTKQTSPPPPPKGTKKAGRKTLELREEQKSPPKQSRWKLQNLPNRRPSNPILVPNCFARHSSALPSLFCHRSRFCSLSLSALQFHFSLVSDRTSAPKLFYFASSKFSSLFVVRIGSNILSFHVRMFLCCSAVSVFSFRYGRCYHLSLCFYPL